MVLVAIEEHHNRPCKTLRDYTSKQWMLEILFLTSNFHPQDIVRTLWRQRELGRNALTSQNANNNIVGLLSTVGVEH